jgi:heme exporter protein D
VERFLSFVSMGGYAAYVWPALGLTFAMMLGLLYTSARAMRRNEADLARLERSVRESDNET